MKIKMAIPSSWSGALKFFKYAQRARSPFTYLCSKVAERQFLFPRSCIGQCNMYSSNLKGMASGDIEGSVLNPKKKKVFIPRVTLLTENDEISVVTLEMADKIAKRRNLKLVKIVDFDTKTDRPTYKLMTTKEYLREDSVRKQAKKLEKELSLKPEKLVSVTDKISEHDLQTKLKSIVKFLAKKHEVRFVVTFSGSEEKSTQICTQLETVVKDLPVKVKKIKSSNRVKIHLCPNLEDIRKASDDSKIEADEIKDTPPVAPAS